MMVFAHDKLLTLMLIPHQQRTIFTKYRKSFHIYLDCGILNGMKVSGVTMKQSYCFFKDIYLLPCRTASSFSQRNVIKEDTDLITARWVSCFLFGAQYLPTDANIFLFFVCLFTSIVVQLETLKISATIIILRVQLKSNKMVEKMQWAYTCY